MSEVQEWVDAHAEVLRAVVPEKFHMLAPDQMMAVGAHVEREYGYTGYGVRVLVGDRAGALFAVCHSDGSEFRLWADRWGNVARVPDAAVVA